MNVQEVVDIPKCKSW